MNNIKIYSSSEIIKKILLLDNKSLKKKKLLNILFVYGNSENNKNIEEYKEKNIYNNILKVVFKYMEVLLGIDVNEKWENNIILLLKNKEKNTGLYECDNHQIIILIFKFLNECGLNKLNKMFIMFIVKIIKSIDK